VDRRNFVLFLSLSALVLMLNQLWIASHQPPPAAKQEAAADAGKEEGGKDGAKADENKEAEKADNEPAGEGPKKDAPAENAAAKAAPEAEAPLPAEFVTLGSIDDASGYRMLVTLTNQGAAVRRIELANPRFLDLHDRSGYLGHLELVAGGGKGLLVQTVGAGTPAAQAGLQKGDRLLEAGARGATTPLAAEEDLDKALSDARPGNDATLVVERGGARQTLLATLGRRPLEVIRPEAENVLLRTKKLPDDFKAPSSFLFTLQEVDKSKIAADAESLPGVDLHDANWRIVPNAGGEQAASSVAFERRVPKYGFVITKRYHLAKASEQPVAEGGMPAYDLTMEISVRNEGQDPHDVAYRLDGPNGLPIEGWWYAQKVNRKGGTGIRDIVGRYFDGVTQERGPVYILKDLAPDPETGKVRNTADGFEGSNLAYVGVDAQYFCVALIPGGQKNDTPQPWIPRVGCIIAGTKPDVAKGDGRYANTSCRLLSKTFTLKPGEELKHAYTVFAGPKRPELLASYKSAGDPAYSLRDFVYYGWFGPIAQLMLGILHFFHGIVRNYGVAIIGLTVLVRGSMFPISRRQAKSMAKLQELKPEMERIKEKYKGDQTKQAQATQQLYRKHHVNPLGGCLPALIQLPVFVGLYRGLAVDVELRGSPLFSQNIHWCSNLAAPDMLLNWSSFMPNVIVGYLGPYLNVLPLATIVLYLWQQKLFTPPPANEQAEMQQKMMKYMTMFMGILFYKVASGLCLYFIASSLWGIAERKLIPPATTPTAEAPVKSARTESAAADKRASKNGRSGGKAPAKSKRRR
jgi:YidC/Oxa1 family membrane protein insertase